MALIRVEGRGTFQNSVALHQFGEHLQQPGVSPRFVVDLDHCPTMDSTFMGTLARIALHQSSTGNGRLIVCNANEQNKRLLKTLGLTHLLDVRQQTPEKLEKAEAELRPAQVAEVGRLDRVILMITAHEQLVDLDTQNEVRFQNVLKYLRQSLQEEQQEEKKKEEDTQA